MKIPAIQPVPRTPKQLYDLAYRLLRYGPQDIKLPVDMPDGSTLAMSPRQLIEKVNWALQGSPPRQFQWALSTVESLQQLEEYRGIVS